MENNFNLLCYDFNEELIALINKYGEKIPACVMEMLIKDVLTQVTEEKNKIIIDLLYEREAAKGDAKIVEIPARIVEESTVE